MKANEAPLRIYLVIDPVWGSMSVNYNRNDTNNIEYTRTDAFIEKACKFLKDRIEHDSIDYPMATHWLIEDFKKYMEE